MWLLDVFSPRSDPRCRSGARQERFQSKAAHRDEYAFTESQHSSLDLFYRETPLRSVCSSALMVPQAAQICLAVLTASQILTLRESLLLAWASTACTIAK